MNTCALKILRATKLLPLLLLLALPAVAQAQFTFTTNNNQITITSYTDPGGAVIIPDTINGYPVTSIGTNAFEYASLTSVSIPDSVTSIEDGAFFNCNLTGVTIPASVTSIGDSAFAYCYSLTNIIVATSNLTYSSLSGVLFDKAQVTLLQFPSGLDGSYTLPNGVTSIGDNAFGGCGLTIVTIPASVTSIGDAAFEGTSLTNITVAASNPDYSSSGGVLFDKAQVTLLQFPGSLGGSYTIPASVTSIGDSAFGGCSSLTSVTIPGSVTSIGDYAFESAGLTSVTIPNSVTSIGSDAFSDCTSLTSVTIPASVTSIGDSAFAYCYSLTNITVAASNPAYSSLSGVLFDKAQVTLLQFPSGSGGSYTIPNGVTSIGDNAFGGCGLTSVTIPASVTSIGSYAFYYCSSLEGVYFQGNSPTPNNDLTVFYGNNYGDNYAVGYYLPGTTGWGTMFDGLPTMLSNPAGGSSATTLTVLYTFTDNDGIDFPSPSVLLAGTLYGAAALGGANGNGTLFAINTDGTGLTNLHTFAATSSVLHVNNIGYPINSDGEDPGQLLLSSNTLYGTAPHGGTNGSGTVFAINTDGTGFTNIYTFTVLSGSSVPSGTNSDGAAPDGARLTVLNNTLYGTASLGGITGNGTVFKVNTDGTGFTNLHTFAAGTGSFPSVENNEGAFPNGTLTLSGNTLYGTTSSGGTRAGVLFKVNTDGSGFTNFYSFTGGDDGSLPVGLLLLSGNTLYGSAIHGGTNGNGTLFKLHTDGTGFTILHTFAGGIGNYPYVTNSDGSGPALVILTNNTLYGSAGYGGSSGKGVLFKLNTDGTGFTILHSFQALSGNAGIYGYGTNIEGSVPGSLILSGNTLYGTAGEGGTNGFGTLFALNFSAPPSVGITKAGNQIVIFWPTNATGYALQSIANLSSGSWSNVASGITIVGTNYVFTSTPNRNAAFFRLTQ